MSKVSPLEQSIEQNDKSRGAKSSKAPKPQENIQEPPGTWLQRQMHSNWYSTYGMSVLFFRFTMVKEMCKRNNKFDPGSEPKNSGEVVVITGGPRGIAYELAKKLLQLDFIVIMGCREVTSSQKKIDEIRQSGVSSGTMHLLPLNLKSLSSCKEFSEGVLKLTSRIDYLFNNAGIMMTPYECTEDGYEAQFQVNYLSHFLITLRLLPTIKKTAGERPSGSSCRIINTTSDFHHAGKLDFDDLETKKVYAPSKCYYDSKLCQVLFTKELEKRLQQEKANVHVYGVHPGAIPTDLWQTAGYSFFSSMMKNLLPTTEAGAGNLLHAALSSDLETEGGCYLEGLDVAKPNSEANNLMYQERLWTRSETFCREFL